MSYYLEPLYMFRVKEGSFCRKLFNTVFVQTDYMGSLKEAIATIKEATTQAHAQCRFRSQEYEPVSFSELCFLTTSKHPRLRTDYLDGGQQIIFTSSSFLIGVVRVAVSAWEGKTRAAVVRKEFFALITPGKTRYEISFFNMDGEGDKPFKDEFFTGAACFKVASYEPEEIFGIIRRNAELALAQEQCAKAGLLCLDGSLRTFHPSETRLMEKLQQTCSDKKTYLAGLQKTTGIMTESGETLQALAHLAPKNPWMSSKLCKHSIATHLASIHAAKLHSNARHVFVIDLMDDSTAQMVLDELCSNACDPVFLGYPYGLVDADRLARVEGAEKEHYRLKIRKLLGEYNKYLHVETASKDAHDILDSMHY